MKQKNILFFRWLKFKGCFAVFLLVSRPYRWCWSTSCQKMKCLSRKWMTTWNRECSVYSNIISPVFRSVARKRLEGCNMWIFRINSVVYFNQVTGPCSNWKLVKILFFSHFQPNLFISKPFSVILRLKSTKNVWK